MGFKAVVEGSGPFYKAIEGLNINLYIAWKSPSIFLKKELNCGFYFWDFELFQTLILFLMRVFYMHGSATHLANLPVLVLPCFLAFCGVLNTSQINPSAVRLSPAYYPGL